MVFVLTLSSMLISLWLWYYVYMKRIYRSKENKVWKGILGGLGEYLAVDPVIVRLLFIFFMLATGFFPGLITYLLGVLIIPKRPHEMAEVVEDKQDN